MIPGKITRAVVREYIIDCGICESYEVWHAINKREFEYVWRSKYGWSKTVKYGWVCPKCKNQGVRDE